MTWSELQQTLQEGGESVLNILNTFIECLKLDASTSDKNAGKIFLPSVIIKVSILHLTLTIIANNLYLLFCPKCRTDIDNEQTLKMMQDAIKSNAVLEGFTKKKRPNEKVEIDVSCAAF
jgi:hypothetical protein